MYGPKIYPEKDKMLISETDEGWTVTRFHSYVGLAGNKHRPYTYRKIFANEIAALDFAKNRVSKRKTKGPPTETVYLLELS